MVQYLFDRDAIVQNRSRAKPEGMFLHEIAFDNIKERLTEVNRTFTSPAIVTGFPAFWKELVPRALICDDEEFLPLKKESHDLVIHAMGLHSANDPLGQIIQCANALTADGLFLSVCFGGSTLATVRELTTKAEIEICDGAHPRFHPMADVREYGALLQRAGLALPVADRFEQKVRYRNLKSVFQDLRDMGETNALQARNKGLTSKSLFDCASKLWNGEPVSFEMIFLSAWKPHHSQQKPLRPGSAKISLLEALKP